MIDELERVLLKHAHDIHPIVPFNSSTDKLLPMDFTAANKELDLPLLRDTDAFCLWVEDKLNNAGARYGIGGYRENRILYQRSPLFDASEARTVHLGIDIWGKAGTEVYAPLGGMVHSFAFNDNFGDYGATIILQHQLDTVNFYTLYGHLSLADIGDIRIGQVITRGTCFAHFGPPAENGQWPPHLHFQLILDMGNLEGDYPGVCMPGEAKKYFDNSPDPTALLNFR